MFLLRLPRGWRNCLLVGCTNLKLFKLECEDHLRKIYTEEKAKILADIWRTELHRDDKKKRMNSSYSSNRPGAKSQVWQGILTNSVPQTAVTILCRLFCINPSSMVKRMSNKHVYKISERQAPPVKLGWK